MKIATTLSDGREVSVRLEYDLEPEEVRFTGAFIEDNDGWELGIGGARCAPGDRFVKETGRKLALTRAIADLGVGKNDRRRIWEAYHARSDNRFGAKVINRIDLMLGLRPAAPCNLFNTGRAAFFLARLAPLTISAGVR